MFLLQSWHSDLNFSDQTVGDAKAKEALFVNFFGAVKDLLRDRFAYLRLPVGWQQHSEDRHIMDMILEAKDLVHQAFCDNFDTKSAILVLANLVTELTKYMKKFPHTMAVMTIQKAAIFVTDILRVVGVVEGNHDIGFQIGGESNGQNKEAIVTPIVDALQQFRQKIRMEVLKNPKSESSTAILNLCDSVRDDVLPPLGIRLEDRSDGSSRWRLDDAATLLREIEEKRAVAAVKARQKLDKEIAKLEKEIKTDLAISVAPQDFFKTSGEYSKFDDNGMPTHTKDGKELSKAQCKKLVKKLKAHKKKFDKFIAKLGNLSLEESLASKREKLAALKQA
jgi:cysteinyl-tRNA synthetase